MRFWIGKRLELPVVGGVYTGVSVPFHPGRVLTREGSQQQAAWMTFVSFFIIGIPFWLLIFWWYGSSQAGR